jgi:hypothetical protein
MNWFSQALVWIYGLSALYFLYLVSMGIFVYFADKSMGHNKSFNLWQKSFYMLDGCYNYVHKLFYLPYFLSENRVVGSFIVINPFSRCIYLCLSIYFQQVEDGTDHILLTNNNHTNGLFI